MAMTAGASSDSMLLTGCKGLALAAAAGNARLHGRAAEAWAITPTARGCASKDGTKEEQGDEVVSMTIMLLPQSIFRMRMNGVI